MAKKRTAAGIAADDVTADAKVFRAAVHDVRPLPQTPPPAGLSKPKPRTRPRADEMMPLVTGLPADETSSMAEAVTGGTLLSFQRAGVRTQEMRRLRRGLYPIEDELDLHGFDQAGARDRLADFIARGRNGGCRCVRIIHGKGYRSGARGPVLKTAVNHWLRRHADVMAFVSARAIDGGAGAVYVLLRA